MVFFASFAACFTKNYKVMKKIYLCYADAFEFNKSCVIRVFANEAHARAYCDFKNSLDSSLDFHYYYEAENLLIGRDAESFLRAIMNETSE